MKLRKPTRRLFLVWTARILSVIFAALTIYLTYAQYTTTPDPKSQLAFLGSLFTPIISFLLWRVKTTDKPQHPQELITREEYARKLRAELEKQEGKFIQLRSEADEPLEPGYEPWEDIFLSPRPEATTSEKSLDTIEEVVAKYSTSGPPKFVLIGDPGSGKSTTLRHLALRKIKEYQQGIKQDRDETMPLWIDLGDGSNPQEADLLLKYWHDEKHGIKGRLKTDLETGHFWLFLDGFNEWLDQGDRATRIESLRNFVQAINCPLIVSCRTADYGKHYLNLPVVRLKPLDKDRVQLLAEKYLKSRSPSFMGALEKVSGRLVLATNPLNLSLMLDLFDKGYELPEQQGQLFDLFVEFRYCRERKLDCWDKDENLWTSARQQAASEVNKLRPTWQRLAFAMFMDGATTISQKWAARQLVHRPWRWLPQAGRRRLHELVRLGLLITKIEDRRVEFYHQSLLDHFALPLVKTALAPHPNLFRNDVARRVSIIERIGRLEAQATSILPELERLYVAEAHKEDNRVYGATLVAAMAIAFGNPDEAARRLVWVLLAEAALANVVVWRFVLFVGLGRPPARELAFALGLAFGRACDLALAHDCSLDCSLDRARTFSFALGRARAINRTLTRTRDRDRELALVLAQDLDLTQALNHVNALDLMLDRARGVAFALDGALARALDFARALDHARDSVFALDRARAIDVDRVITRAHRPASPRAFVRGLERLDHARAREAAYTLDNARGVAYTLNRARDLSHDLDLDLTLILSRDRDLSHILGSALDRSVDFAKRLDFDVDRANARARVLGLGPSIGLASTLGFAHDHAEAICRKLASALDLAHSLNLDRVRSLDLDLGSNEIRARAEELGLEPFDAEKIEARRRELLAELPGLAAEVVRAYEAGEMNA